MFVLPDVASACIAGVELVWVVVSVTFTVDEDDEPNTVGFAVTDSSAVLCVRDEDDWLTEMLNVTVLLYRNEIFLHIY